MDKIIDAFIGRMSQEDKEKLLERTIEKFFSDMSPEEKRKLIEKMLPKLLEDIDIKDLLSYIMITMWKGGELIKTIKDF